VLQYESLLLLKGMTSCMRLWVLMCESVTCTTCAVLLELRVMCCTLLSACVIA
jgi:hypothetical protein